MTMMHHLVQRQGEPQFQLESIAAWFDLDPIKVSEFVDFYNSRMDQYGNEVYSQIESRIAHWLNFSEDRWFNDRLTDYLECVGKFDVVVDLGFSVPYAYAGAMTSDSALSRFVFVDKEKSARSFYDALVREADLGDYAHHDEVIIADIEDAATHEAILMAAAKNEPLSLLVVASEILEHLRDPETAWELIHQLSQLPGLQTASTYVTLPIGSKIPSHVMEFWSRDAATDYLAQHLSISKTKVLEAPHTFAGLSFLTGCVCVTGVAR